MPDSFDLDAEITRLLTPRKTLAPWIFTSDGIMKEDVREGLLNIARKVVADTVADIEGLTVTDVCLVGSSPHYLYKDNSDFDIRIEVHNTGCSQLPSDDKLLNPFLVAQKIGFFARGYDVRFLNRFVDVQISSIPVVFFSIYSIKNNKWVIKPDKNVAKGLTLSDVKAYYLKRKAEVLSEFEQIKAENKGAVRGKKLEKFVECLIDDFYATNKIEEYFTYKLFHYERIIKTIRRESAIAFVEELKEEEADDAKI